MSTIVCMLEMPGSATSLPMCILRLLGVHFGACGVGVESIAQSSSGLVGQEPFVKINDGILDKFGGRWSDPPSFPQHWESHPRLATLKRQARRLIDGYSPGEEIWGWSDARTCLTLPFWRQIVVPTHYVVCVGNPADLASSSEMVGVKLQHAARLWIQYVAPALRETSGSNRLVVFYEDMIADWRGCMSELAKFVGLSTRFDAETEAAVERLFKDVPPTITAEMLGATEEHDLSFAAASLYTALRLSKAQAEPREGGLNRPHLLETFAEHCLAFQEIGDVSGRSSPSQDMLSLFWDSGDGFSGADCVSKAVVCDGRLNRFRFELPPGARGALRLDPGSRMMFGEIRSIVLHAGSAVQPRNDRSKAGQQPEAFPGRTYRWSPENGFSGITTANDLVRIPGGSSYRFIVLGDDPQLLLNVAIVDEDNSGSVLEITIRLLEDFRDVLVNEAIGLVEAATDAEARVAREQALLLEASRRRAHADEKAKAEALESGLKKIKAELQAESDERDRQLHQALAELARKEEEVRGANEELRRMRGTLGWRLLSVYGLVKHKLLKPAYRFVFSGGQRREGPIVAPPKVTEAEQAGPGPNAVEEVTTSLDSAEPARETPATVAPLATCPAIVPLNQIQPGRERGTWEALDMDPQFLLEPPYPSGWVRMAVHVDAPNSYRDHAWLYVDTGSGYSQEASYDLGEVNLPQSTYMYFDQGIVALRLDPLEGPDVFTITVELHPATADEAQRVLQPERPSTVEPGPGFKIPPRIDPYDSWLEINQWSSRREAVLREQLEELDDLPTISVVMPVYDPPPEFLNLAIQSVVDQVYDRWELCIADDASRDRRIRLLLEQWASRDSRIKLAFRELNGGISEASNRAAELATGEYLLLIDNDDALAHDALAEAALYFSHRPDTDVLYGDEDKVDAKGRRYDPAFKPDWSPELFLSYNYLNHPLFLRRSLFWQAGGFRTQMNLAQDWDLGLRVTEAARHVGHIPKVLYHWRAIPSSVAYSGESKPKGMLAARDVLADAFRRRGIQAEVFQPDWAVAGALALYGHRFADNGPSVSILIPTKNNVAILRACIDSLARTTYANYEIVVIDDGSDDPKTLEYLAQIPHRVLRIPSPNGAFSFADINNQAVEQVSSDYVLFLNDDTEVIAPEWLSQMVGYLGIPGVGAVGARLLYPNGRVQHAGVIHASHLPGPWHAFRYGSARDPGFMWWSMSTRNCSAVTAACMLTPRNLFMEIGGFDAEAFPVAYNDVDYCYRLLGSGRRIVFSATSELIHHESISRGPDGDPAELARIFTKYRDFTDKYYSPYLRDIGPVALAPRILTGPLKRPPRTLVCTHNLNFEGAPLVQMEITLGLRDRGVIDPVVHSPEDGPLRAEYESWGVPVEIRPHPLESVARTNEGYKIGMEVFTRWVQGIDVDLVYGNTLRTFYAIDAARMAGLPSIWNPRESEDWRSYFDEFGPEIAARALECFAYPYKVVFVSQASENGFAELCSRWNFMTIHDGMDKAKFGSAFRTTSRSAARRKLGVADHEVVVVTVGTVGPRKGQVDIPRAIALMDYQTVSSMRWYVVGDRNYDYSGTVRERQSSLDEARASRMEIVPETPDVLTYYSAADVFVCTSRIESFPRVILEAMAAGLPIVTTPVFGILEQVRPGRNALLYDPGDVQALAAAVTRMVNEPGLRQRMGAASLPALETLIDQDAMVTAYADVFREAWLSGAPRGKRRPKEEAASPVSQTGGGRGRAFAR